MLGDRRRENITRTEHTSTTIHDCRHAPWCYLCPMPANEHTEHTEGKEGKDDKNQCAAPGQPTVTVTVSPPCTPPPNPPDGKPEPPTLTVTVKAEFQYPGHP
jgi:hypothetical protein